MGQVAPLHVAERPLPLACVASHALLVSMNLGFKWAGVAADDVMWRLSVAPSIGEVKRRTRCGMGRCQGRYCAPVLAAWLAEAQGRPLDAMAMFAPQAPIKPVAIADIVAR